MLAEALPEREVGSESASRAADGDAPDKKPLT